MEVRWSYHSETSYRDHLQPLGLSLRQASDLIPVPNWTKKRDELDPIPPRVRRWVLAGGHKLRVVLETVRPAGPDDPGEVKVVTLFDETRPL